MLRNLLIVCVNLCLGSLVSEDLSQPATTSESRPIRKVITLLEEMKMQVEKEASADQTAYEKYMCWCQTNEKEKTAAIKTAEQRIEDLGSLIEKSTAEAGTLKTEIASLKEDISSDQDALATASSVREKEKEEFLAEESDVKETVSLLSEAIAVLAKVQLLQKHTGGSDREAKKAAAALLQVHDALAQRRGSGFRGVMQQDLFDLLGSFKEIAKEVTSGEAPLGALQVGQPSAPQGQAAGAKSYNARSGSILGVLREMRGEMSKDLAASQKQDFQAEVTFQKLRAAKLAEIKAASEQKESKEEQLAANLDKTANAKEDLESTTEALAADQDFIGNMRQTCKAEDGEYKERVAVRSEEIRALGEALRILTADDARDLYAKTMSFVQVAASGRTAAQDQAVERSTRRIAEVARRHRSWALAALAVRMRLDTFSKVKEAMDKMLAELQKQQKEESAKLELCTRQIDEVEDSIKEGEHLKQDLAQKHQALADTIETLTAEIAGLESDVKDMQVSLKQAGEERKSQNGVFQSSMADQRATISILNKALARLKAFYSFRQASARGLKRQEPGAAVPPPPPSPKDYQKSAGAGGVLQLLAKIIKDAEIAEQELAQSEQKSQADYAAFVKDATASIEADRTAIGQKKAQAAEASSGRSETEEAQLANEEDLSKQNDLLKAHHLECDFVIKYYDMRQKARAEEMDSIKEAKAILSGADFGDK
mmetsp:Transcript_79939/g.248056  ORF Transcript_79939/g.248056 Transcript_79939/m.248056 type:complete len:713 (-) Transcript_79939:54-2192(-)|eukprot:CAMPEP_0204567878 /NCGR_PEP_ID=MMETSP0661-20131031/36846_1 /ASSEMBLY_ACC=CAM_ASM_000606 /TAXON_ID=109239 /ORGANISM="Alexandrium margalefi, Strain AMGDE01CS-322" /LENGTH=712 /DNA_ID=CAMNT_0051575833 /DNA_START=68 /DNA_END=2206 /DNA_ORIENTATION=+